MNLAAGQIVKAQPPLERRASLAHDIPSCASPRAVPWETWGTRFVVLSDSSSDLKGGQR